MNEYTNTLLLASTRSSGDVGALFVGCAPAFDDAPDFLSGLDAVLEHPVENENSGVEGFGEDSETWAFT